jgi:hypothetical protein
VAKREIEVQGTFWAIGRDRRPWPEEDNEPFPVRILITPGRTEKPTDRQLREIERSQPLLEMACRAEEIFDLDYLERFAAGREK